MLIFFDVPIIALLAGCETVKKSGAQGSRLDEARADLGFRILGF